MGKNPHRKGIGSSSKISFKSQKSVVELGETLNAREVDIEPLPMK